MLVIFYQQGMKQRFITFILSGLAAFGISCMSSQQPTNVTVPQVNTKFEGNAQLSPEKLQDVIQLARKAGMSSVALIYTFNFHPSSSFGIGVSGKEEILGRKIRTENLQVTYSSWMGTNWHPHPGEINVGKFWADPKSRHTNEFTTFQVTNLNLRIQLYENLSVKIADDLLAAIAAGKIRFTDDKVRQAWASVQLTMLVEMAKRGDDYSFYFTPDRYICVFFECEFKNGEIFVKKTGTMLS
jgi:hypothetical protein